MKKAIKNFLKNKFYILKIREKFSSEVQISQRNIFNYYQECAKKKEVVGIENTGYRVFSQFEEDGKLIYIFSIIGFDTKLFIEIGSNDGINSNCANLAFNFGWHGLFIDGDKKSIDRGRKFYRKYPHPWGHPPVFSQNIVTRENINNIIEKSGFKGDVDLLSIDIDGNDYWVWDALDVVQPKVVIIETHIEFGLNNIVVPYDPNYQFPGKHPVYHGASPVAMTKLAKKKGYRLVGANELGFNFIFIKNGFGNELIPEVKVEDVLKHPSVKECYKLFDEIKDWEYIEG